MRLLMLSIGKRVITRMFLAVICAAGWLPSGIFAQSSDDSLRYDPVTKPLNGLSSFYSKQLNVNSLFGELHFGADYQPMYFQLDNKLNSTIIQSNERAVKESFSSKIKNSYSLIPSFDLGWTASYSKFSDSRPTGINSISQGFAELFGRYAFTPDLYLAFAGGYERNSQIGILDNGMIWRLESILRDIDIFDTYFSSLLQLREENTDPRLNRNRAFSLTMRKVFENRLEDHFYASYEYQRNDFYVAADTSVIGKYRVTHNIQQRGESLLMISNRLDNVMVMPEAVFISLRTSVWQRVIERRYKYLPESYQNSSAFPDRIEELKFDIAGDIDWNNRFQHLKCFGIYSQRDEKHSIPDRLNIPEIIYRDHTQSEALKNNVSKRISIGCNAQWIFSDKDIVDLSLSHNKLQYDTPDAQNVDDRDELLSIARLSYSRWISPFFSVRGALEGNLNKFTYIFKERSANNYLNRVIKLSLGSNYRGVAFSNSNSFDISSFYTVYDYEDWVTSVKSYSYRQVNIQDSLNILISDRFKLRCNGNYKYSEQGILFWSSYSLQPMRNIEEYYLHLQAVAYAWNIEFSIGWRLFSTTMMSYQGRVKSRDEVLKSAGPSSGIQYYAGSKFELSFFGWIERQQRTNNPDVEQSNFQFSLKYFL